MQRHVMVFLYDVHVGALTQNDEGYLFEYLPDYMGAPISLSLPVLQKRFPSNTLHPYFASLAPEGWLKKKYSQLQRSDENDLLGMLINNRENMIGAIHFKLEAGA